MEPSELIFLSIETFAALAFPVTISSFPSPSISPIDTHRGAAPVVIRTSEAKEIFPCPVLIFLNTETEFKVEFVLAATISVFPSPSISPTATAHEPLPIE